MTMLLTRPDEVGGRDGDTTARRGHGADPTTASVTTPLLNRETVAPHREARDWNTPEQTDHQSPQQLGALDSTSSDDNPPIGSSGLQDALKREATERISRLMDCCQAIVGSADRLLAIRVFLDGSTSIEADLLSHYGDAGSEAFWAGMRTATGRWIETHASPTGLPIVIDSGIVVDDLAALMLAATPDFPPLLRLNTSIASHSNRSAVIAWAERVLASGRPAATLSTHDLHTLSSTVR